MLGFFGSRGRTKSKGLSGSDISLPYDFRIETHIEPGSSVRDVVYFANHHTAPNHHWRPNLLTPNPDWPSVGNRQRFSKEPLTEEELRKSPFGKYLKDAQRVKPTVSTFDSGRADLSSMNSSTSTVPSSPIPRAPTRYRDRIPSPWMNPPRKDMETRTNLHRVNSKSLPHITKPLCEFRGCDSCEVCKKGTITSRIYFPTTALHPRAMGSQRDVRNDRILQTRQEEVSQVTTKVDVDDEEYDEIVTRNNTQIRKRSILTIVPATIPRSTRENAPVKPIDQRRLAPSPPPRGVPVRKTSPKRECLGYSTVTVVSAEIPPDNSDSLSNDSDALSFQVEPPPVVLRSRRSMDSGVGDDEEPKVTRL